MTAKQQMKYGRLIPVMLCFFAMGFVWIWSELPPIM